MAMKHYLKRWNRDTQVHDLIPCVVIRRDRRRPLRMRGQRLGSWTNKFYKDMSRISFTVGKYHHRTWVKTCRIVSMPEIRPMDYEEDDDIYAREIPEMDYTQD